MNPNDPNVAMMEVVAHRLGADLRECLVFVGGAVAGLLITDPAQPAIRPTEDVDLIVQAAVRADYHRVEASLRAKGFTNDLRADAPICRWQVAGVTVDVMPTLAEVIGFTNRWYALAIASAETLVLPSGVAIRVIAAPVFVATKFEAFHDRGHGDYLLSHDLGDLLAIIDGRETILAECQTSPPDLQTYLADAFTRLLATPAFHDALPGHLPGDAASQARLPDLLKKLRQLARTRP